MLIPWAWMSLNLSASFVECRGVIGPDRLKSGDCDHLMSSCKKPASIAWLTGDLSPDQVSRAFQCSANVMLVSDEMWQVRGECAWLSVLESAIYCSFCVQVWSTVTDFLQLRE